MKEIVFSCWASSGKCDSTDWKWEFEVSDEEYDRLKRVVDNEDCFSDCPDVADIYARLYSAMLDEQADVYLENKNLLQEIVEDMELEDAADITREQIVDYLQERYSWGIDLPDSLIEQ